MKSKLRQAVEDMPNLGISPEDQVWLTTFLAAIHWLLEKDMITDSFFEDAKAAFIADIRERRD